MGCCESFAKTLLIIFNIIFFLIGVIFLGVGIWVKVDKSNLFEIMRKVDLADTANSFESSNSSFLNIVAIVLIVMGTFTFIIGFCGCCGAIKENQCLLYLYSFLVGFVILIEIGIGIYAGVEKANFQKSLEKSLQNILIKNFNGIFNNTKASVFTKVFTAVMFELDCCGAKSMDDFSSIYLNWSYAMENGTRQKNPVGCCATKQKFTYDYNLNFKTNEALDAMKDRNCPFKDANSTALNKEGCVQSLLNLINKNIGIVIGVCVGLGLFEIFCIVFACCVIRKEYS